jgi:protocatechuate 3,4-dioxygenase beta subunit
LEDSVKRLESNAAFPADEDGHDWCPPLDRRAAVRLLGLGAVGVLASCGEDSTNSPTTPTLSSSCGTTLEGEEGPFFVNDSGSGYERTNVVANLGGSNVQAGAALALSITVLDTKNSCRPLQGVQVDIWSCNAFGVYSGESSQGTTNESWLRGYQLTDNSGKVLFNTIVPGWYAGRATHVHLRLRSIYDGAASGGTNTTQLFFDQTVINNIHASVPPYSTRGINPTPNASDRVFSQQERGTNVLSLTGSAGAGYSAAITLYVPIAAS